jgi:hypothetical protein
MGIQSSTGWDDSNIISGGYFLSNLLSDPEIDTLNGGLYDSWQALIDDYWTFVDLSMAAVQVVDGVGYFTLTYDGLVLGDSVPHILVVPNGMMGIYISPDFSNFYWVLNGNTTISSEFATKRAMSIISATMSVDTPVMRSLGPDNTSAMSATVYDQDNNPVVGADVAVYVQAYGARPFFTADAAPATDATGSTTTTVTAQHEDTSKVPLFNPVRQPLYANPSLTDYATIFASTEIFNIPIQLFLDIDVEKRLEFSDPSTTITATVTDESGNPMEGLSVMFSSDKGTLGAESGTTDSSGEASVSFEYAVSLRFDVASLQVLVEPEAGYIAASGSVKVEGYNEPSSFGTITPASGTEIKEDHVTIEGTVSDPEGVDTVQLILDGGTPVNVTVTAGAFSHEFTDLEEGSHTVDIIAIDGQGDTTETDIQFTVSLEEEEEFPWLSIIVAIIVIVIIIIIIAAVMRSRAAPAEMEEEMPMEEEAPLEEEMAEEPMEEAPSEPEEETLSEE